MFDLGAGDRNGVYATDVEGADREFSTGKTAVARVFAATVLPELAARRVVVETTDNALMAVAVTAF